MLTSLTDQPGTQYIIFLYLVSPHHQPFLISFMSMMEVIRLLFLLFPQLIHGSAVPRKCNILAATSLFRRNVSDSNIGARHGVGADLDEQTLGDFAKFINKKVPALLEEFARSQMYKSRREPKHLDNFEEIQSIFNQIELEKSLIDAREVSPPTDEQDNEDIADRVVQNVVDSMNNLVESVQSQAISVEGVKAIFTGIINGIKASLIKHNVTTPIMETPEPEVELSVLSSWPLLCKTIWYPYHEQYCQSTRCAACAPAVLAGSHVCREREGHVTEMCLQSTIGQGYCNRCISDYDY